MFNYVSCQLSAPPHKETDEDRHEQEREDAERNSNFPASVEPS